MTSIEEAVSKIAPNSLLENEAIRVEFRNEINRVLNDEALAINAKLRRRLKRILEIIDSAVVSSVSTVMKNNKPVVTSFSNIPKSIISIASNASFGSADKVVTPGSENEKSTPLCDVLPLLKSAKNAEDVEKALANVSNRSSDIFDKTIVADFLRLLDIIQLNTSLTIQSKLKRKIKRLYESISSTFMTSSSSSTSDNADNFALSDKEGNENPSSISMDEIIAMVTILFSEVL